MKMKIQLKISDVVTMTTTYTCTLCLRSLLKPICSHVSFEVRAQTSRLSKRPIAHPAFVGLLPRVQSLVTPQGARLAECPGAELALVRPLPSVYPCVGTQAPLRVELPLTPGTLPPAAVLAAHEHAVEEVGLGGAAADVVCPPRRLTDVCHTLC